MNPAAPSVRARTIPLKKKKMSDNPPVMPEKTAVSPLDVPASLQSAMPPLPVLLRILLLATIQGFGFGYFFERCHVFQPEAIREQVIK